jgi:hypothetical protein
VESDWVAIRGGSGSSVGVTILCSGVTAGKGHAHLRRCNATSWFLHSSTNGSEDAPGTVKSTNRVRCRSGVSQVCQILGRLGNIGQYSVLSLDAGL